MTLRSSVLATICYADVFDFPLTKEEIEKWLIKKSKLTKIHGVNTNGEFFFLKGRKKIVALRRNRQRWTGEKMRIAKRAADILKIIPTIKLIGITGALAMENAHKDDDIDFYVVAASGTLWTTRLLATVILDLFGLRRRPGQLIVRNKLCLNMFVDERNLAVGKSERDLFTAHEVLQMKPLWDRGDAYGRFLLANKWVSKFLPNAYHATPATSSKKIFGIWHVVLSILEPVARYVQLWYMQKRRSSEVVSPTLIRFHPKDARVWVKARYGALLSRYKIPLDKIFYAR